jgi:TonB family protein
MTVPKSLIQPTSEDHLTTGQLYQYLEGELASDTAQQVEQHLLDCELCADALVGLSMVPQENTELNLFEINRQVKSRSIRRKKNTLLTDIKNWGLATAIVFLLVFSAIAVWYLARKATPEPVSPTLPTIIKPVPVSGESAYLNYLSGNLQYPPEALLNKIEGTVKVAFTINPDSTLTGIKVLQSVGFGCDEEAVRLVQKGPKWIPPFRHGQPVEGQHELNITFRLPAKQ